MRVGATLKQPMMETIILAHGKVVDAGDATAHQPPTHQLPILLL